MLKKRVKLYTSGLDTFPLSLTILKYNAKDCSKRDFQLHRSSSIKITEGKHTIVCIKTREFLSMKQNTFINFI